MRRRGETLSPSTGGVIDELRSAKETVATLNYVAIGGLVGLGLAIGVLATLAVVKR